MNDQFAIGKGSLSELAQACRALAHYIDKEPDKARAKELKNILGNASDILDGVERCPLVLTRDPDADLQAPARGYIPAPASRVERE